MFETLIARLRGETFDNVTETETRLAIAALLVGADRSDASETDLGHEVIEDSLVSLFIIDQDQASELAALGQKVEDSCTDISQVTALVVAGSNEDMRERVLAEVWEVLVADCEATEREQNYASRLALLLGLSVEQAEQARKLVIARHLDPDDFKGIPRT